MAVLTAKSISSLAVALLTRSLVLPATVSRIPGQDFAGPNGSTITVRVRQPRASRKQTTPGAAITFDDIDEVPVDVTVSHLYAASHVTDEDLSLGLEDFGRQVLQPMVAGVAIGAEDEVATALNALAPDASFASTATAADTDDAIKAAREALSTNKVPAGNRWLACAPDVITRLLGVDKFVKVNESGGTTALQQASFGTIYGFRVVESGALDAGTAVAYHSSGIAFGNRSPVPPSSVDADQSTENGIALRVVRAFDTSVLSEAVAVSTFAGAAIVTETAIGDDVTLTTSASTDDIIDTTTDHGFTAGDRVVFTSLTGGAGLETDREYYVIAANLAATTFQVSETSGGTAVDFTTNITAGTVRASGTLQRVYKIDTAAA